MKNILGQSFGIRLKLGNEWDSEYPEHKRVQQQHKTGSIYRPERGVAVEKKKMGVRGGKEAGIGRGKKQVDSGFITQARNQIPLEKIITFFSRKIVNWSILSFKLYPSYFFC